jgi:hypothetical protein
MFGLLGHFRVGQSDVNAMLGDMSNLIGVDEPTAGVGIDHQPIKDVLLLDGQLLFDSPHLPAVLSVDGRTSRQRLVGDRQSGVIFGAHQSTLAPRG